MTKYFLAICFSLVTLSACSQPSIGKIADYDHGAMEIVVFPFGSDYPVKIGTVDKAGQVSINLDDVDISKIPKDIKAPFYGRVTENVFVKCDDPDGLKISNTIKAIDCEMPFLLHNKETAGALFLVSDEKLKPWIEDRYSNEPVKASFYKIIYIDQELTLQTTCNTTYNYEGSSTEIVAVNNFNLKLKKGFNLVQFSIEDIHNTESVEISSTPSRILILNPKEDASIQWLAKFF